MYLINILGLVLNKIYYRRLPKWTKKVFPGGDMEYIAARCEVVNTNTTELARLRAGFLINKIFTNMAKKAYKKLNPNRSIWIYSGHDITVTAFLNALKIFNVRKCFF